MTLPENFPVPHRCNNAQEQLEAILGYIAQNPGQEVTCSVPASEMVKVFYELVFLQAFYDAQKEKEALTTANN
jgi:hypothetical protein